MKRIAVHSKDEMLLWAFQKRLQKTGFSKGAEHQGNFILINPDLKQYAIHSHDGNYDTYILPEQWNEALKIIDSQRFKVGDWIITNHGRIGNIIQAKSINFKNAVLTDASNVWFDKNDIRQATTEEIKQELIKRSGLQIGDKVKHKVLNKIIEVKGFDILGTPHGWQLLIKTEKMRHRVTNVKKMDDLNIATSKGMYTPHIKNGRLKIGCLELSETELDKIHVMAKCCANYNYGIYIDENGNISDFTFEGEELEDEITLDDIRNLKDLFYA